MSLIIFQKRGSMILVFLGLLLSGCAVSLAADVTPPPDAQSFSASDQPAPVSGSIFPIVPPDPANGQLIYMDKCAACHGEQGMGDGPQGLQLSVPVPPLGDPSLARGARPVEWYQMVTEGNLERFMPPFRSLDDRQRWDVVAYAMTLSMRSEVLAEGKQIYEANCMSCHGEEGEGSLGVPGWQEDSSRLAQLSIMEVAGVIAGGKGSMTGFSGQIDPSQIVSAATYVQTLGYSSKPESAAVAENPEVIPQVANEEPEISDVIDITGLVTNASGEALPEGLDVTLTAYDGMTQVFEVKTTLDENGSYFLGGIELAPSRTYIASVQYQGMTFNSDVYHNLGQPPAEGINLPVQIYGTTTDTSALRVDRMHIFFDLTNPEVVQVVELFLVNNTGNSVIVDDGSGRGVVRFDLPEGAQNLQFQDGVLGERYLPTETGFVDTSSFTPGAGAQILYAYDLPFKRKMDINITVPLAVDAAIVMMPQGTVSLQSDQLQFMGQQDIQGVNIDLYSVAGLPAGSVLNMTLSGRAAAASGLADGSTGGLIIGGSVFVVALLGVGYWFYRQRKRGAGVDVLEDADVEEESSEDLMDAIIALDDRFKAGEITEEAYLHRRAELKDRLKGQAQP